ncbi:hypothetical protein Tco_0842217 [Tanacetum coccineum]|uniref:Uncharacterized protein n=1 Tax=Tanacetum coccineum TaxID=301880 RepID=A0ABQ5AYM6_9ASTR
MKSRDFSKNLDEVYEAWDRFNVSFKGMALIRDFQNSINSILSIMTLNSIDQDSLNSAARLVILRQNMPRELLKIIESKSRHGLGIIKIERTNTQLRPGKAVEQSCVIVGEDAAAQFQSANSGISTPEGIKSNSISCFNVRFWNLPGYTVTTPKRKHLIVTIFLLKEADSFLALEDDPTSSEVDPTYQDLRGTS